MNNKIVRQEIMIAVNLQIVCGLNSALLDFDHLVPADIRILKPRGEQGGCSRNALTGAQVSQRTPPSLGHERMFRGSGNAMSERRTQTPDRLHSAGYNGDDLAFAQAQIIVTGQRMAEADFTGQDFVNASPLSCIRIYHTRFADHAFRKTVFTETFNLPADALRKLHRIVIGDQA